jgi:YggT family protein
MRAATCLASLTGGAAPVTSFFQILLLILDVAQWIIIAHIIMSWLINFQVLNLRQPLVAQIWDGLSRVLDPIYSRVRSFLPSMAGIDFAPLIVLLCIIGLRIIIVNNAGMFL